MSGELTTFLLRGWAELIENGHCTPNYVPPLADKRIIFCTIDGRIVSLLMWEWNNLYQIMHRYYDSRVSSGGAVDSKSQLHISNTAIIQAAMKQGYEIEYYRMIKRY
jgi:hypothetical protein